MKGQLVLKTLGNSPNVSLKLSEPFGPIKVLVTVEKPTITALLNSSFKYLAIYLKTEPTSFLTDQPWYAL